MCVFLINIIMFSRLNLYRYYDYKRRDILGIEALSQFAYIL